MKIIALLLLAALAVLILKNLTTPKSTGIINGRLHPCPSTPNCVNSDENIAPFEHVRQETLQEIERFLQEHYKVKVVNKSDDYLHLVITTPRLRFKDDVEFLFVKEQNKISIRSASRIGYSDRGLNRERIEKLRHNLRI